MNARRETVLVRMVMMVLAAAMAAAPARAGFTDGLSSAAAEGTGDASVARTGEAGVLFVNPGSLGVLDRGDATLMYAKPLTGIPDVSMQQGVAAVAVPVGRSWTLAGGARYFDDAGLSRETEAGAGVAFRMGKLSVGGAGKFLQRSFNVGGIPGASSDPVFAGGSSKSGIGVDAGFSYEASSVLTVGAAARNLNQPNLGLVGEDKVPMTWRAGAAYKWDRFTFLGEGRGSSQSNSVDSKWGLGVECRLMGPLMLRAGAQKGEVSAGMGVSLRDLRVDYAFSFLQDLGAGQGGNHRISVGYRFGEARDMTGDAAPQPRPVYRPARPATRPVSRPAAQARPSQQTVGYETSTRDVRAYPTATPVKKKAVKKAQPKKIRPLD